MEKRCINNVKYDFAELSIFEYHLIKSNYDEKKLIDLHIQKMRKPVPVKNRLSRYRSRYLNETDFLKIGNQYFHKPRYENHTYEEILPIAIDEIEKMKSEAEKLDPDMYYSSDHYDIMNKNPLNQEDRDYLLNLRHSILESVDKMDKKKYAKLQKIENKKEEIRKKKERIKNEKYEIIEYNKVKPEIDSNYKDGMDFIKSSKYPEAIYSFSLAIKLDNFNREERDLFYHRGMAKFEVGDFLGSINDFNISISRFGHKQETYYKVGLSYFYLKEYENAINNFTFSIKIDLEHKESHFYMGLSKIYYSKEEKDDKYKMGGCLDLSKAGELGYFEAYEEIKKNCN